jgi:hypothetical protein
MPYLLAVNLSVPAKSVRDVINLAKAQPGKLVFSSSGAGTSSHLTMEMFRAMAKLDMLHVPYKGGGPAVTAVISGETQLTFNVITGVLPHARSGKLRALAVSSAKRAEIAPEFPTIAESGVPGFEVIAWYNMFAPARTPRAVVERINGEINRMLLQPEMRERLLALGVSPLGGTPEALGKFLRFEVERWAKLIGDTGVVAGLARRDGRCADGDEPGPFAAAILTTPFQRTACSLGGNRCFLERCVSEEDSDVFQKLTWPLDHRVRSQVTERCHSGSHIQPRPFLSRPHARRQYRSSFRRCITWRHADGVAGGKQRCRPGLSFPVIATDDTGRARTIAQKLYQRPGEAGHW